MLRRSIVVFVVVLLILCLSSCQKEINGSALLSGKSLAYDLSDAFPIEHGYSTYDTDTIRLYFPQSAERLPEITVLYSVRPDDYTEFGVFVLNDCTEEEIVVQEVSDYLKDFRETYAVQAELYDPDQKEKLSDASLRCVNNCVIYTIMSKNEQQRFWKKVKDLFRE